MGWTIDDAISDTTLRDAKIHVAEVSFRLGELTPKIRVRLYRLPGDKEVYYEQSHFLQVSAQEEPAMPSLKSDINEAYALTHAVETLTRGYHTAVEQGHAPADGWLVPNTDF